MTAVTWVARRLATLTKSGLATLLLFGVSASALVVEASPAAAVMPTWPTAQYGGVLPNEPFSIPIAVTAGTPLTSMTVNTGPGANFSGFGLANVNLAAGTADMVGTYTGPFPNTIVYNASIDATNGDGTATGTYSLEAYNCSWSTKNYRAVTDGATTASSKTVTSNTANFTTADVGQPIVSPVATGNSPIPPGATITAVNNTTHKSATMSVAAVSSRVGLTLYIGSATDNASTSVLNPVTATYATGSQSTYGAAITNGVHTGEWVSPSGCTNMFLPLVGAGIIMPSNPFAGAITPNNSDNSSSESDLPLGYGNVMTGGSHNFSFGSVGLYDPVSWSNGGTLTLSIGTQSDEGDTNTALATCPPTQDAVNAGLVTCSMTANTGSTSSSFTFSSDELLTNGQPLPQTTTFSLNSGSVAAGGSLSVTGGTNWWGSSAGTNLPGLVPVPSPGIYIGTSRATAVPATSSSVEISPTVYACGQASPTNPPNPCTFSQGTPSGSFTVPASLAPGTYNVYLDETNSTPLMGNGPNDTYTNTVNPACVVGAAGSSGCNGTDEAVASITVTAPSLMITSADNKSVTEGVGSLNFSVTTAGTPTPSLSESGSLPSGVTFIDNGDGTATLGGTPAWGTAGSYPITISAVNGGSPVTQNFTLTVTPGASISLTKSSTTANYSAAGDPINYSYLVTNTGVSSVSGVAVSDNLIPSVSCPSGSLDPGNAVTCTGTYTATQSDVDAGSVTNVATASATTLGSTTVTSNSSSVTVAEATRPSSISLTKSATSPGYGAAGDTINYDYQVTNTGSNPVSGVSVSDNLIPSVSCPSGTVDPGNSVTCTGAYTATQADVDAGSVTNTATAAATDSQSNPISSNPSTVTVNAIYATSSISLVKSTTSTGYAEAGQTIPYDYRVTNTGTRTEHGVAVSDNKIASVSCPSGNVAPGNSVTCTGSYVTTQADVDGGSVTNTATATATDPQGNSVPSNSSSVTVGWSHPPSTVSLVKSTTSTGYGAAGDTIAYSYTVTNTGVATEHGVSVSDNKIASVSCPSGNVAPGSVVTCSATYTVTQADVDAGSVTNTATASAIDAAGNSVTSNLSSVTVDASKATSSISLVKSTTSSGYGSAGQSIPYSYRVTNTGTRTEHAVAVSDNKITSVSCPSGNVAPGASVTCTASYVTTQGDVDAGSVTNTATATATDSQNNPVTSNSSSVTVSASCACTALSLVKSSTVSSFDAVGAVIPYSYQVINTGTRTWHAVSVSDNKIASVNCPSGSVSPGNSVTCTATYVATQADVDAGSVTNIATATATDSLDNAVFSNPSAVTVPWSGPLASISLVKSTTASGFSDAGDAIPYSYQVTNTGTRTVHGVSVSDNKIASVSCPSGNVAPGASATCTASYTATQADVDAGSVTNVATATATDSLSNSVTSNSSTVTVTSCVCSALQLVKSTTSLGYQQAGDTIAYSYQVTNTGNRTVHGVSVSDDKIASVSCPSGNVAPGGSVTCSASYTVTAADVTAGSVTNVATASATDSAADSVISDSSSVTVALTAPGGVAITSAASTTATEGSLSSFMVTTTSGSNLPTISDNGSTLPAGISFTDNGDGTATLGGTPGCGTAGTYLIALSATNGVGSPATQTLTLVVNPAGLAHPTITSAGSATAVAGTPFSFTVTTSCNPIPGISAPSTDGLMLADNHNGTATLSGTPTNGGTYLIGILAQDYLGIAGQSFSLTVLQAPGFTSSKTATETTGTPFSFTIKTKGNPTPSITGVSTPALPPGVTLVDQGNGTAILSGTAPVGHSGAYSIALDASNDVTPDGTQTLTVSFDEAPAITSGNTLSVQRNVTMTNFAITTTGYPVPTVTASGLPAGLTVKLISGVYNISGKPTATDALGPYAVTVTAHNAKGSATQPLTVTVTS